MILGEVAVTPDVFDAGFFTSADVQKQILERLREPLLYEVLVRSLRDQEWETAVLEAARSSNAAKNLIQVLAKRRRFRRFTPQLPTPPTNHFGWCAEAIASHGAEPLHRVLATPDVAARFKHSGLVSSTDGLSICPWFSSRSPNVRPSRETAAYLRTLNLALRHANRLVFVDAHLDPSRTTPSTTYAEFIDLLEAARRVSLPPRIEIHRVAYSGQGAARVDYMGAGRPLLEANFHTAWATRLAAVGLQVRVLVWAHFHDRYFVSDLVSFNPANGFDIDRVRHGQNPSKTIWNRLGRQAIEEVEREFDRATSPWNFLYEFTVP
ncbi:MAG: hypothetical protein ABSH05_20080 [Bryobacteraceae bacterium]